MKRWIDNDDDGDVLKTDEEVDRHKAGGATQRPDLAAAHPDPRLH